MHLDPFPLWSVINDTLKITINSFNSKKFTLLLSTSFVIKYNLCLCNLLYIYFIFMSREKVRDSITIKVYIDKSYTRIYNVCILTY